MAQDSPNPSEDKQGVENIGQQRADQVLGGRFSGNQTTRQDEARAAEQAASQAQTPVENADDLRQAEFAPAGKWTDNTKGKKKAKLTSGKSTLRRFGPFMGLGAGVVILGLLISALLPFKLNMFYDNILKAASEVPGYAMQRRTEYIATRLLATQLLRKASGLSPADSDVKAKMVFCKNASISCSLMSTYTADYFESLMDIHIDGTSGDSVKMTITPKGRTSLGGNARSWEVDVSRTLDGTQLENTTRVLTSNTEAKAYVRDLVDTNLKTKSIATRYLARAILMKKYGITHWRAFEKTTNNIADTRDDINTKILKNTVGKVSSRMSLYLACMSSQSVCDNMREGFATESADVQKQIDELDENAPNYEAEKARLENQKEALDKLSGNTPLSDEDLASGATKQIILRRLLLAGGVVGLVGTIDMIFHIVGAADQGALEQISADMAKFMYTGFDFGDDVGLIPNVDKIKAGDGDLEVYGVLSGLLDGAEQSPLMQYETGLISAADVASKSYSRTCNVNDEQVVVTLPKGQLVCPERQIVRDYTSLLRTNPAWQTLAATAEVWNRSVGVIIGAITGFVGDALNSIPIIEWMTSLVNDIAKPAIEWALSIFFVPPPVGSKETGENNYDAMSGGLRNSQNEMMEEGVSDTGKAYGGGGSVLTQRETAAIVNEVRADEDAKFQSQPLVARIFDLNLSGSFAQQFLARIPTSLGGITSLSRTSFASLLSSLSPSTSAAEATTVNPFNLPMYGYAVNDPTLTANPANYTEASCAASAQAREDSYGSDLTRSTIPTYGKSDPCALEKMVVGTMLQARGVTDDPYSLQEPGTEVAAGVVTSPTGRPPNAIDKDRGWTLAHGQDYSQGIECDPRTEPAGIYTNPTYGFTVKLCRITFNTGAGNSNGSSLVNAWISKNAMDMFEAARTEGGVELGLSDGMRYVGPSGYYSEHTTGLAMDIASPYSGSTICRAGADSRTGWGSAANAEAQCARIGGTQYKAYKWLQQNAARFGFYNYVVEPWHWSTSGA